MSSQPKRCRNFQHTAKVHSSFMVIQYGWTKNAAKPKPLGCCLKTTNSCYFPEISINCFMILWTILANITTWLFTFLNIYPPVKTNMGCKNPPSRQGNMRQLRVQFGALSVGKNYPSNGSKCRKNKKKLGGSTTFLWFVDLKIWSISIIDFEDSFVFFFVFWLVTW